MILSIWCRWSGGRLRLQAADGPAHEGSLPHFPLLLHAQRRKWRSRCSIKCGSHTDPSIFALAGVCVRACRSSARTCCSTTTTWPSPSPSSARSPPSRSSSSAPPPGAASSGNQPTNSVYSSHLDRSTLKKQLSRKPG